jgi:uncharacterized Zn-finger protein
LQLDRADFEQALGFYATHRHANPPRSFNIAQNGLLPGSQYPPELEACNRDLPIMSSRIVAKRRKATVNGYLCEFNDCDFADPDPQTMRRHIHQHHLGTYPCDREGCGKTFGMAIDLKRHVEGVHEKKRPFACGQPGCSSTFTTKQNLENHVLGVHSNCRPYKCKWQGCERAYLHAHQLADHVSVFHRKEKPYACDWEDCDRTFASRDGLKYHEKTAHLEKKERARPHACDQCEEAYSNKKDLQKHIRTEHSSMKSDNENVSTASVAGPEKPRKGKEKKQPVTTFTCTRATCDKSYSNQSDLTNHMKTHTITMKFMCSCGK